MSVDKDLVDRVAVYNNPESRMLPMFDRRYRMLHEFDKHYPPLPHLISELLILGVEPETITFDLLEELIKEYEKYRIKNGGTE